MPVLGFGLYQSVSPFDSATTALQLGYKHLDSARVYRNEDKTVEAVNAAATADDSVWITSKITCREYARASTRVAVEQSVETAKQMGLKWSLFLLHDPCGGRAKRFEAWQELERFQREGAFKSIGVSNFSEKHLQQLVDDGAATVPDVNQIELHPWCQQRPIVDYCKRNNIVVEAYCPIVRGTKFDDPTLQQVATRTGRTPAQVLVRWSLQKGYVPLVKSDTPSRIKENAQVFDFELSEQDMEELDALDQGSAGACSWNPISVE
ncbi:hypothetical protein OIO90_000592 [Microbotryomycetes sp. JL221]|nr:hypothetical protein OIO90_000592 [Microbotryomycetes sp. JL221]